MMAEEPAMEGVKREALLAATVSVRELRPLLLVMPRFRSSCHFAERT